MPKLDKVTNEMLNRLCDDTGFDIGQLAHDYAERIGKGYAEDVQKPLDWGRACLTISRSFADLSAQLLIKHAFQEQRRELEKRLKGDPEEAFRELRVAGETAMWVLDRHRIDGPDQNPKGFRDLLHNAVQQAKKFAK